MASRCFYFKGGRVQWRTAKGFGRVENRDERLINHLRQLQSSVVCMLLRIFRWFSFLVPRAVWAVCTVSQSLVFPSTRSKDKLIFAGSTGIPHIGALSDHSDYNRSHSKWDMDVYFMCLSHCHKTRCNHHRWGAIQRSGRGSKIWRFWKFRDDFCVRPCLTD